MRPLARLLGAVGLLGFFACASPRPSEFVNIAFTPSVDTDDYHTWDFELASCRDFDDPRVDDDFLRAELLAAIEDELTERGYERRPGAAVDFTVYYELAGADAGDLVGVEERMRGRIFVRDTVTQRLVWRGERKAPVTGENSTPEAQAEAVRRFVKDLLQYTSKLAEPEEQG